MIDIGYELIWITCQRDLCAYGIKHGNWEGNSERLVVRKQRLKELNEEIEEIKKQIASNEIQKKLFD